ncbi:MAG: EscU/YscU/HrcU family type III secretion system export apparatus switch protein [Pseudomonadota bacterium]
MAVALKYEHGIDPAPRVVAKGEGELAESILDLARANDVTVRQDADLARLLARVEMDSPIPAEAFAAVAEILSYIYRVNGRLRKAAKP